MTTLREDRRVEIEPPPVRWTAEWLLGMLGALTAAIGAYAHHGGADAGLAVPGGIEIFGIPAALPLGLLVVGGLLVFGGFGRMARQMFFRDDEYTIPIVASALVAVTGLAVAFTYLTVWIF